MTRSSCYVFENANTFIFSSNIVVPAHEFVAPCRGHGDSALGTFDGEYIVARQQRLEIRLFGSRILAEGIAGIVGAIVLVCLILITYFKA